MAVNGPTLVPHPSTDDATTAVSLTSSEEIGQQVGRWSLGEAVRIAPHVTGSMAESRIGRGVFAVSSSRELNAGNAWIRRAIWWLRTHRAGEVPQLLDHGMASDGRLWMVRTAAPPSWRAMLETEGTIAVLPAARALSAAAASLAHVHESGWAHQALRLDVIHAPQSGRSVISAWGDVGLAQGNCYRASSSWDADPSEPPPITGAARDVGALGHLFLELVTPDSRVLRRAGHVSDAVQTALPDPGIEFRVLRHIISGAVHPDPQERWSSAGVLANELTTWLDTFGQGRWPA